MPNDWNISVFRPIYKKEDPAVCANYGGISLLNIAYEVLSTVLCGRRKPIVNKLIEPYQCGFKPGKSDFYSMSNPEEDPRQQIDTHLY